MNKANRKASPTMIGSRGSHEWILRTLKTLPKGCALDAPAGRGALSVFMRDQGFEVHCADIDPGHLKDKDFPFEKIDLNQRLPYEDNSFDVVVCANSLHRVANFRGALSEFSRILKPGGSLLLSFNNYASIAKRLKFLLCGSLSETNNELTHQQTIDDPMANFRQALFFPAVHYGLLNAGLQVKKVRPQSRRINHYLLWPVAALVWAASFLQSPRTNRRNCVNVTRGRAVNFGGKSIFVHANKPQ